MLLHTLGMAIGLIAINPDYPGSLRGVGIGTGIWSLIAPLIALFIGGAVASRVSGSITRIGAVMHGAVVWALSIVASMLLMVAMVDAILGGMSHVVVSGQGTATTREVLQGAETSGKIMFGMFLVLLVGLGSSILGAFLVENRLVKKHLPRIRVETYTPTARGAM